MSWRSDNVSEIIKPMNVAVNEEKVFTAEIITCPLEYLRSRNETICQALKEKRNILTEIYDEKEKKFESQDLRNIHYKLKLSAEQMRIITDFCLKTSENLLATLESFDVILRKKTLLKSDQLLKLCLLVYLYINRILVMIWCKDIKSKLLNIGKEKLIESKR